jgi:putative ABC transport system permease protein
MGGRLKQLLARLLAFVRVRALDRDLQAEIDAHLAMATEDQIRLGHTPAEARRLAMMHLGGATALRDKHRAVRGLPAVDALLVDLRFAVRSLMATPSFTVVAFVTIALTVAGVSTVFTLVNAVVLTPLPYRDAGRFVSITQFEPFLARDFTSTSALDLLDVRSESRTLEMVAAYRHTVYALGPDEEPYRVALWTTMADLFSLLGVQPIRGRGLLREDETPEAPPVLVISHEMWTNRFGGRDDIIGERLEVPRGRGTSLWFTIVGVMPSGFELPVGSIGLPGAWTALRASEMDRRSRGYIALGKVRRGVALAAVRDELDAIRRRLAEAHPDTNRERRFAVVRTLDQVVGDTKQVLWMFFGAVSCVLLIGVANLVGLQTARNAARAREFAICAALGGGRGRLVRQQLVETLLLSAAAGAVGALTTWVSLEAVAAILPRNFPRADGIAFGPAVVGFAFSVSLAVGIAFGLIPAWRVSSRDLALVINEATRSATMSAGRVRLQRALIAVESGLALVLVVGAALLANSFWRLFAVDSGIRDEDRVRSVQVILPAIYQSLEGRNPFWRAALERLRGLPQVETAAVMVNAPPPLGGADILVGGLMPEGKAGDPRNVGVSLSNRPVSGDYFTSLGIPMLRGRPILDSDNRADEAVAVLNESAARALWPGDDALGKRIVNVPGRQVLTVVGIVRDFKHRRLDENPAPQLYRSFEQEGSPRLTGVFIIRVRPGAAGYLDAFQTALVSIEPKAVVTNRSVAELRWTLIAAERFRTGILLVFALSATLLALIGIVGLVAYTVEQRAREIGLRIAIGALNRDVQKLVVGQAMVPAMIGIVVGLVAAVSLSRFVASFLFEVSATDPLTYAGAVIGLATAALTASLLPARKAVRVDPMTALRCD